MKYLIWSFEHRGWWAPNKYGYKHTVAEAGRYSAEEAVEIIANDIMREEIPVREMEATDTGWPAVDRSTRVPA